VLTCSSAQSRNLSFGMALGRGETVDVASASQLAEGAFTALALTEIAREHGVDMPIANCVEALLEGDLDVAGAVGALLGRPQKGEE
jgi:glycerol-3-phosphate dehydrogenase (NAD(P)+)